MNKHDNLPAKSRKTPKFIFYTLNTLKVNNSFDTLNFVATHGTALLTSQNAHRYFRM